MKQTIREIFADKTNRKRFPMHTSLEHTERLIDEARENVNVNGLRGHTEWTHKNGECSSREYKLGFADWKHYGKEGNPEWCTDVVSLTLKVFADGKERKIFSINHFGASRKNCEALIVSKQPSEN